MKPVAHTLALLSLVAAFAVHAAESAPDALVKSTVNDVLTVLKQNKDKRTLLDLAEQKVLPNFDFAEMTRLAVGRAWRDASDAQKKALENAFRTLLVNTYTAALTQAAKSDQTVDVKPVRVQPDQKDVVVKTLVKEPGRSPIPIDYSMRRTASGWKVYDVVVENLSLVTNYRSSFSSEVARGGIDGLIKALEEKNRKIADG
ncbi:MAG TPA: ABC transporter substrate-binding protein [Burkholderiales bacterium]|jgi:phospholipid transport system substrate-binding protein|nr:ABC transporter substrate-binding protein [Burkholderiales bacterium]